MSHGHGHNHGPAAPASARVRRLVVGLLLPLAVLTIVGAVLLYPWGKHTAAGNAVDGPAITEHAVVTKVVASNCGGGGNGGGAKQCESVTVQLDNQATITEPMPIEPSTPRFSVGDKVVLGYNGGDPNDPGSYQLLDFQRGFPLALLGVLFAAAVLILGRMQGLKALGALVLTFVVIVLFVLPAMLAGKDPLSVGVVGAALIMFMVLYLTHGLSARTSTAVVGTLVSLGLIGVLGWLFSAVANLTGLDEDTANLITVLGHGIDARGLLLAGIVIGSVGVLDDVTVTQTSAVWELRRANPKLGWRELYAAGLRIGRDHMSSSVNTLVMAYAGAALPLLLAYAASGRGVSDVLTAETVAQELVRTLVGSIGLVASVPITTVLAALIARQEKIPVPEIVEPEPEPEPADPAPVRKRVDQDEMPTEQFRGVAEQEPTRRQRPPENGRRREPSTQRRPDEARRREPPPRREQPHREPPAQQPRREPQPRQRQEPPRRQPPPDVREQHTQVSPRRGQLPPPQPRQRRSPIPPEPPRYRGPELPGGHPSAPPDLRRPITPPEIAADDPPRH
ncbi:YibE/F family protein [Kutzneria buriramensis]|uniref:YibE/F family protein n=1 Tax=Kutzneria buriramensis TaxID=1045776 RepID=UPI001FEB1A01|nr:YibE/F family protein [Kutzneria buriramensis]